MSDTNENCTYGYDYENKCDCREDDNCGCTFPNNMPHDFDCRCGDEDENFSCEDNDDADCCECENLICDTLHCQNLIVENLELPAEGKLPLQLRSGSRSGAGFCCSGGNARQHDCQ